jgi:hypothetical protein
MEEVKQEGQEPKNLTVSIDMNHVMQLAEDGKNLVFNPNAEEAILQLLELQNAIDSVISMVKNGITDQALAYNPAFTSVSGDKIKATYSAAGAKYGVDFNKVKHPRAPFFNRKVTYSLDTKLVEKYEMKHKGRLPVGVFKRDRNKNLTFRLKAGSNE